MSLFIRHLGALLKRPLQCSIAVRPCASQAAETQADPDDDTEKPEEFTNVEGLKEFFDDPETFGADKVRHGRSWKVDELRIKSNRDLHKLWYVLLKERNVLLTLEAAAKDEVEQMPSPERLDKVEESMENLEAVVRERNKAYFDLEIGEPSERPVEVKSDWMGIVRRMRLTEHWLPQRYNSSFNLLNPLPFNDKNQRWFLTHYSELEQKKKARLSTYSF